MDKSMAIVIFILIMVVVVVLTVGLFIMIRKPGIDNPDPHFYGKSMEILNERLASGEISVEEYDQLKRKMQEKVIPEAYKK